MTFGEWTHSSSFTNFSTPQPSVPHGAVGMDCEKANKGLFSGLLIAVVTLIAIATFFVFESRLNYPETAIKVRVWISTPREYSVARVRNVLKYVLCILR